MTILLDTHYVESAWNHWAADKGLPSLFSYSSRGRRDYDKQRFDIWVFSQGGVIQRINKKNYILFDDPHDATVFKLQYI